MRQFIMRTIINSLTLMFILPAVSSIAFVGQFFPEAIIAGMLFAVVAQLVHWVIGRFLLVTLGIGFIFLLFFWWLIPAIKLAILASLFPEVIIIPGFGSAVWGGLVFMVINMATGGLVLKAKSD